MSTVQQIISNQQQAEARLIVTLIGGDEQAATMAAALVRGGRTADVAANIALNNHADRMNGVPCHSRVAACDGCRAAYNHHYTGERPKVCGCLCHEEHGTERGVL